MNVEETWAEFLTEVDTCAVGCKNHPDSAYPMSEPPGVYRCRRCRQLEAAKAYAQARVLEALEEVRIISLRERRRAGR